MKRLILSDPATDRLVLFSCHFVYTESIEVRLSKWNYTKNECPVPPFSDSY